VGDALKFLQMVNNVQHCCTSKPEAIDSFRDPARRARGSKYAPEFKYGD
jgi:hypothetical protein